MLAHVRPCTFAPLLDSSSTSTADQPNPSRHSLRIRLTKKKKVVRTRRRERKNIAIGQAHVQSTFNNTIIAITDVEGNVISWGSAGSQGFKGSRKSTPFAAQITAQATARKARDQPRHTSMTLVPCPGPHHPASSRPLTGPAPLRP